MAAGFGLLARTAMAEDFLSGAGKDVGYLVSTSYVRTKKQISANYKLTATGNRHIVDCLYLVVGYQRLLGVDCPNR